MSDTENTRVVNIQKHRPNRTQVSTWNLTDEQLEHSVQLESVRRIQSGTNWNRYDRRIVSHIRAKLSNYKRQDIKKKMYDPDTFVSNADVIPLLDTVGLTCYYCHNDIYVLYKCVRDPAQWTLDRIDNTIGHVSANVVAACLRCNLRRRCADNNRFYFSQNIVITQNSK